MRLCPLALLSSFTFAVALVAACGSTVSSGPADGGTADGSVADGAGTDGSPADGATSTDADGAMGRCPGSTYTTAPGGGACDPERVRFVHVRGDSCLAPTAGTFCDSFQFSAADLDAGAVPAGFACGSPELGVSTCRWVTEGGGGQALGDDALSAACAVTQALPGVTVDCIVYE